jgi:hypothetical protein
LNKALKKRNIAAVDIIATVISGGHKPLKESVQ